MNLRKNHVFASFPGDLGEAGRPGLSGTPGSRGLCNVHLSSEKKINNNTKLLHPLIVLWILQAWKENQGCQELGCLDQLVPKVNFSCWFKSFLEITCSKSIPVLYILYHIKIQSFLKWNYKFFTNHSVDYSILIPGHMGEKGLPGKTQ